MKFTVSQNTNLRPNLKALGFSGFRKKWRWIVDLGLRIHSLAPPPPDSRVNFEQSWKSSIDSGEAPANKICYIGNGVVNISIDPFSLVLFPSV